LFDQLLLVHSPRLSRSRFGKSALLQDLAETPARAAQCLVERSLGQLHFLADVLFVMVFEIKALEHQAVPGLRQLTQQSPHREGGLEVSRLRFDASGRVRFTLGCFAVYIGLLSLGLPQ
jgi:hypothetical protein